MRRPLALAALGTAAVVAAALFQLAVVSGAGSARAADCFFAALAIPQAAISLFGTPLAPVIVPLLASRGPEASRRDGASLVLLVAFIAAIGAAAIALLTPLWIPVLVSGFDAAARASTVRLTRILTVGAAAGLASLAASAVGQARGRFVEVEGVQALATLASLAALPAFLARFGIEGAAWLWSLRMALGFLLLLPLLGAPRLDRTLVEEGLRRLRPMVLSGAVFRVEPLIDRAISSRAPAGGLALLAVAQQAALAAAQVLQKSLVAPALPSLARSFGCGDEEGFHRRTRALFRSVTLLATGAWAVAAALSWPVLTALASRHLLRDGDARVLTRLAVALGLSFVAGAAGMVTSSALFARGDTRTPARYGVLTFLPYLLLKLLAFLALGLEGIAASAGIYTLVNVVLQRRAIAATRKGPA